MDNHNHLQCSVDHHHGSNQVDQRLPS